MSEARHSPAPWKYVDNDFDGYIEASDGTIVAGGERSEGRLEDDADTRLMVAAPDLLAACEATLEKLQQLNSHFYPDGEWNVVAELRTVIAKARGERT